MKEKQKRKFKIVHIILGIIAGVVLIPLLLFSYLFVINPMYNTRIVSSKATEDINEYFAALSEQDYERAADYIRIYEITDEHTIIERGREEWIDRMEQLEQSGITIQDVQDIHTHTDDGCVRYVFFDVVIDANGTTLKFPAQANPLTAEPVRKCPSADSYRLLNVVYSTRTKHAPEIEQAKFAISSELVRE